MGVYQPYTNRVHRYLGRLALTSVNMSAPPRAGVVYTPSMQLTSTDQQIVELVGRFKHLTTNHIKRLVYPGKANNPQVRTINRLLDSKLLARVNQRMPGGAKGGSQLYVYQLGTAGRRLFPGRRGHSTVVDYHALAIADVYTELFEADLRGDIKLLNWATEPDCHIEFGGVALKPDLYIDIAVNSPDGPVRRLRWLEIDLGTEHKKQVTEKMKLYSHAHAVRTQFPLPIYPTTLYLTTRDERASELRYWMRYVKNMPVGVIDIAGINEALHILQH